VLLHRRRDRRQRIVIIAVARHVLSRNGALDGDGETLRGCSRIAADEQPVNVCPTECSWPTTRAFV